MVSIFVLVFGSAFAANAAVPDPGLVLEKDAITAAQDYIDTIGPTYSADWDKAVAKTPILYYDYSGNPIAYIISVEKNNQEVGYVVVSATTSLFPILEASTSSPPHKQLDNAILEVKKHLKSGEVWYT